MILFASTILLSAFLLFLVQPIIAKQILPWFGGTAAVWTLCMLFFQAVLLAGYAYAHWLSRRRNARTRSVIHMTLLAISLALLPIIPDALWKPEGNENPATLILGLLAVTIGLPYFLLSSTGPLLQKWFSDAYPARTVYRLFALSNFGSLLGLLAYPFLVEPFATSEVQSITWSVVYALFVAACATCAWRARLLPVVTTVAPSDSAGVSRSSTSQSAPPTLTRVFSWVLNAALGSALLLAITSHITQNIATIPFLWVVPLTLYLLTFVICFEGRQGQGWYVRAAWLFPVLAILAAMAWGLSANRGVLDIQIAVPLYCAGLFLACVFLHGELAVSKPAPAWLTHFYLAISFGGALGGLLVALVAPISLEAYFELPVALVIVAMLGVWVARRAPYVMMVTLIPFSATTWYAWQYVDYATSDTLLASRNFYGTLRVKETLPGEYQVRRLLHGVILHGEQFTHPDLRRVPSTYYGPGSGVALALQNLRPEGVPLRVGVIGLGTGTLAAFGRQGDTYRFYELDAEVVDVARRWFTYLDDSAANIATVVGDARLSMDRELAAGQGQQYDVIAIDAFSSDAIPVHLITREALALYARHIKPDGVIAFHVSNRFLDLPPVVRSLADDAGFLAWHVNDDPGEHPSFTRSDWILVTRNKDFLALEKISTAGREITPQPGLRIWTDQFNNLFQILK